MTEDFPSQVNFRDFSLSEPLLKALDDVGYETPTPIQAQTIPHLLEGRDVVGQAQTGTGKTAAFALPILSRIQLKKMKPQALVLTPTRELAIQVAEAFHRYASRIRGFHVAPIYGGQEYGIQMRQLKRGVHVVVGTPGRLMDHMRRGTLDLDALSCLVLDEADEMLRMGFIGDVEWILEQVPAEHQTALFSATMPSAIRKIARQYLTDPVEITVKMRTATAETIRQRFWMVSGVHKLDALNRIFEAEQIDAALVFVRTKTATTELAEKLEARGFAAAALNGDIPQKRRERTIEALKSGKLDILVATDVAARGLDVDRISHVINYDIPYDIEAYVNRIGRTGRAGRKGEAILFVAPRERRLLHQIEKAIKQRIDLMELPSHEIINDQRIARFKDKITDTLAGDELGFYYQLVEQYRQERNVPAIEIAAALAKLLQGDEPLLLPKESRSRPASDREERVRPREKSGKSGKPAKRMKQEQISETDEEGMARFRLEVGRVHGVKPGNIVGAIANEVNLDHEYIGRIDIYEDFSTVDLPEDMPRDVFRVLRKVWVAGQQLNISRVDESPTPTRSKRKNKPAAKNNKKVAKRN